MELSYRQRCTKIIVYAIIIAAGALIQNTSGLSIEIYGARCFVLLPVCIILGMGEDERLAGLMGLFGGMLWDMTSSVHMGFNAVFICLTCFFSAALVTYIIRDTFITNLIFSVISIAAYCIIYWLFFIIIKGVEGAELSLFYFYIPSGIYTAAAAPLIWFVIRPIKKKLNNPR